MEAKLERSVSLTHTRTPSRSSIIETGGLEVEDVMVRTFADGIVINGDCSVSVLDDLSGTLEKLGYQAKFEKHYDHLGWIARTEKHRYLAEDGSLYTLSTRIVAIMKNIGYALTLLQDDFTKGSVFLHFEPSKNRVPRVIKPDPSLGKIIEKS